MSEIQSHTAPQILELIKSKLVSPSSAFIRTGAFTNKMKLSSWKEFIKEIGELNDYGSYITSEKAFAEEIYRSNPEYKYLVSYNSVFDILKSLFRACRGIRLNILFSTFFLLIGAFDGDILFPFIATILGFFPAFHLFNVEKYSNATEKSKKTNLLDALPNLQLSPGLWKFPMYLWATLFVVQFLGEFIPSFDSEFATPMFFAIWIWVIYFWILLLYWVFLHFKILYFLKKYSEENTLDYFMKDPEHPELSIKSLSTVYSIVHLIQFFLFTLTLLSVHYILPRHDELEILNFGYIVLGGVTVINTILIIITSLKVRNTVNFFTQGPIKLQTWVDDITKEVSSVYASILRTREYMFFLEKTILPILASLEADIDPTKKIAITCDVSSSFFSESFLKETKGDFKIYEKQWCDIYLPLADENILQLTFFAKGKSLSKTVSKYSRSGKLKFKSKNKSKYSFQIQYLMKASTNVYQLLPSLAPSVIGVEKEGILALKTKLTYGTKLNNSSSHCSFNTKDSYLDTLTILSGIGNLYKSIKKAE